jgi:uncharacterized protein
MEKVRGRPRTFEELPRAVAWRHLTSRDGFETVFFERAEDGNIIVCGTCAAVEEGVAWSNVYRLMLDGSWRTLSASVDSHSATSGKRSVQLISAHDAEWIVNGELRPDLDGYVDVDLEASAFTNALPLHRLPLARGKVVDAPAVYIRATDLAVGTLQQTYKLLRADERGFRVEYESPAFDFKCELTYDRSGLVVDYPDIAHRFDITSRA